MIKPTEKQIHIYCTAELYDKLKVLAELDERPSMSYTVKKLIEKAYEAHLAALKYNLKG